MGIDIIIMFAVVVYVQVDLLNQNAYNNVHEIVLLINKQVVVGRNCLIYVYSYIYLFVMLCMLFTIS